MTHEKFLSSAAGSWFKANNIDINWWIFIEAGITAILIALVKPLQKTEQEKYLLSFKYGYRRKMIEFFHNPYGNRITKRYKR